MTPKQQSYLKFFSHFAMRLGERYNIFITFDDYMELCDAELTNSKQSRIKRDIVLGYLSVNSIKVRVVKLNMGFNPLITALHVHKISKKKNI